MACFKIYTHIQCILIQITAIFYYVTVTPFLMVQICRAFDMLLSGPNNDPRDPLPDWAKDNHCWDIAQCVV